MSSLTYADVATNLHGLYDLLDLAVQPLAAGVFAAFEGATGSIGFDSGFQQVVVCSRKESGISFPHAPLLPAVSVDTGRSSGLDVRHLLHLHVSMSGGRRRWYGVGSAEDIWCFAPSAVTFRESHGISG